MVANPQENYSAKNIKILDGLEAVRKNRELCKPYCGDYTDRIYNEIKKYVC